MWQIRLADKKKHLEKERLPVYLTNVNKNMV